MYLDLLKTFLPQYDNISVEKFGKILAISNKQDFRPDKLEKDFLLTIILIKLGEKYPDLVFKGGTCLNKIYFPYFRLSEDLDFVINTVDLGRSKRQKILKQYEQSIVGDLSQIGLRLREERTKFDEYKLALFTFEYISVLTGNLQTIKIDISIKNSLQLSPQIQPIQTVFIDEIFEEKIFQNHLIQCIDLTEALAEKMRAALTRPEPAIRDFFDLWYVQNFSGFDFFSIRFQEILSTKMKEVKDECTLDGKKNFLEKQIFTDLQPVLSQTYDFDFEKTWQFVQSFRPTQ